MKKPCGISYKIVIMLMSKTSQFKMACKDDSGCVTHQKLQELKM